MANQPQITQPALSTDRTSTAARILSDVFAPAVSVFLICLMTSLIGQSNLVPGLIWGILLGSLCAVIPMIAIHIAVHRQHLTDRHVTRREQRWWVFLVCAGSVLCAIAATVLFDAPDLVLWILLTMVGGLVLAGTITLIGPKVSMHAFCFTALVILAAMLISPWCLVVFPILFPLVAFARLRLRHHTPTELALGVGLSIAVMLSAGVFMPGVA